MFSLCENKEQLIDSDEVMPEPLKFKFLKFINVWDIVLRKFVYPNKKEQYQFSKDYLTYVSYQNTSHLPIIHFPSRNPSNSLILVYSHGLGSNLNHTFQFGLHVRSKYGIAFVAYDNSGQGQSENQFVSFEFDLKVVLSWVLKKGYDLKKVVLCGFSLGSYSALCLEGRMARILISPIAGLIPFIEQKECEYEGETLNNVENAKKLKTKVMIIHSETERIPVFHSRLIANALLLKNSTEDIDFHLVEEYEHKKMPLFLIRKEGYSLVQDYLKKVYLDSNIEKKDIQTDRLIFELEVMGEKLIQK